MNNKQELESLISRISQEYEEAAREEKSEWQRGYYQGYADGLFQIRRWLKRAKDIIWEEENG